MNKLIECWRLPKENARTSRRLLIDTDFAIVFSLSFASIPNSEYVLAYVALVHFKRAAEPMINVQESYGDSPEFRLSIAKAEQSHYSVEQAVRSLLKSSKLYLSAAQGSFLYCSRSFDETHC